MARSTRLSHDAPRFVVGTMTGTSGTTQPAHAADAPPSDLDLVRAVTAGHDVHNAALRVLRHHLGSTDVRFVAEARPGEEDAVEIDRRGLRQVHVRNDAGHSYGVLLSR